MGEFLRKGITMIREIQKTDFEGLMKLYMQLHDNSMPEKTPEIMELWNRVLGDKDHHCGRGRGRNCFFLCMRYHSQSDSQSAALCVCGECDNG